MLFRTFLTGVVLTAGAFAQMKSFPKPDYFRQTFQATVPKVELQDPVRLKDFVVSGKLELSLKDYLQLVMSNNTNIQIQRISLETPKNAIERAFSPWDPLATASFGATRTLSLPTSQLDSTSSAAVSSLSQPFRATYQQTIDSGTSYSVQYNASKSSGGSSFNNYNPALTSNVQLNITQPLLKNRGRFVNRISLMMARSNYRIADYNWRYTIITLVSNAENAYWGVILARENIKVAEGARKVAQDLMDFTQHQLDLGALSPLDIFQSKQQVAQTDLQLANAQFALTQAEDTLRMQIGVDLDPTIRLLPLVLTESADMPNIDSLKYEPEAAVNEAIANRPDMKGLVQRMDYDDLGIQSAKNGLLPQLDLGGTYSTQGRGGIYYQRSGLGSDAVVNTAPGGFADALSQMFGFGYPIYGGSLTLRLPIKSHSAAMDYADAVVRKKSDALSLRNAQETVRLNVKNAITNLDGSKEQLKLATTLRDISKSNLDAMNQKYSLGVEIIPNVTRAAQDLATAEFQVVSQQIALRRAVLSLLTTTGELLDQRGIVLQ